MNLFNRRNKSTSENQAPHLIHGKEGEDAADRFLKKEGYQMIERNWRPQGGMRGEIDSIAWHHDQRGRKMLCFIEVKTRSANGLGAPQDAVNFTKQRQISRLANAFMAQKRWRDIACRFDVVEVLLDENNKPECRLHQNAFDYTE